MKKSESLMSGREQENTRRLESQKYSSVSLEDAAEAGFDNVYEWFEDMVINKRATVELNIDTEGNESATIHMKPDITKYKGEEYYTDDPEQIKRLKKLAKGETVLIEIPDDPDSDKDS